MAIPLAQGAVVGDGDPYPEGQCTYGAVEFFHDATGVWLPSNLGNAMDWGTNAKADGWTVTDTPSVPSVIVLGPDVQGASNIGHVAEVESINADGTVTAKNLNWGANPTEPTDVNFTPGPGVQFISFLGAANKTPLKLTNTPNSDAPTIGDTQIEAKFKNVAIFLLALVILIAGVGILFKKQLAGLGKVAEKAAVLV